MRSKVPRWNVPFGVIFGLISFSFSQFSRVQFKVTIEMIELHAYDAWLQNTELSHENVPTSIHYDYPFDGNIDVNSLHCNFYQNNELNSKTVWMRCRYACEHDEGKKDLRLDLIWLNCHLYNVALPNEHCVACGWIEKDGMTKRMIVVLFVGGNFVLFLCTFPQMIFKGHKARDCLVQKVRQTRTTMSG